MAARSLGSSLLILALSRPSAGWVATTGALRISNGAASRTESPQLQLFKTPKSTDEAMADQMQRLQDSGMTPAQYEEATRQAANAHLKSAGAHASAGEAAGVQTANFLKQLWGVDSVPAVPTDAASDPTRVLATFYEIGGPLTGVLSGSVAKKLPLIPHVGIRLHGVEYFYSDHIEVRSVPVMEEMLGDRPQVTLDLGPVGVSESELAAVLARLEPTWESKDYHVFDKNCVHFADALAADILPDGRRVPQPLLQASGPDA